MTPSAAEAQGYERASKYPKSTKFGRQNPITAKWNSEEQLLKWWEAWADMVNRHLEQSGHDERIDHRSFVDQVKDEQPTIHEGVAVRIVEKKGGISERCEINRQIRADNKLLRELKALVKKLAESAKDAVIALARKLETIRANMIGSFYALRYNGNRRSEAQKYLNQAVPLYDRYIALHEAIKTHKNDLRRLQKEKDALPVVSIRKRRNLTSQIEEKEAEIAKLQKRKKAVMQKCGKTDHAGMQEIQKQIAMAKAAIQHVDDRQAVIQEAVAKSKRSFLDLLKSPEVYDLDVLEQERLAVRPDAESAIRSGIKEQTDTPIQEQLYIDSLNDVEKSLTTHEKQQLKKQIAKEEMKKKGRLDSVGFIKRLATCYPFYNKMRQSALLCPKGRNRYITACTY